DNGRGSVKRLKDIVNRHRIIPLNQRERFLRYVREFQLELTKLQKPPYAISNGEAVKLFLKGLDKEFLRAITLLLPAAAEDRRVEDPYDIEDIISAANKACANHLAALYSVGADEDDSDIEDVPTKPLVVGTRRKEIVIKNAIKEAKSKAVAKEEDQDEFLQKIAVSLDRNQAQIRELTEKSVLNQDTLQQLAKYIVDRGATKDQIAELSNLSKPKMSPRTGNQMTAREYLCWFCGSKEHRMNECPVQRDFIENRKWVIKEGNAIKLRDGTPVPYGDAQETRQVKIERIAKQRGWPMPKATLFSSAEDNEAAYDLGAEEEAPISRNQYTTLMASIKEQNDRFDQMNKALQSSKN
ncbi:hypothetical protein K435DRAFT_854749, partial [Dendrothele bispora CBS 962.96]